MGSNLKKGLYMKFKVSRRRFKVLVCVGVLSLALLAFGIYLLLRGERIALLDTSEEGNSYVDFIQRCGASSSDSEVTCRAFITERTEMVGENTSCFSLFVYDGVDKVSDTTLCEKSSVFDWENPYGDYEKYVPVLMQISTGKNFLGSSKIANIKITLMDDQEVFDILTTLPEEQGRSSYFQSLIYIKEYQEIFDNGYYITSPRGSGTRNLLVLHDAKLEEIYAEGEKLILSIRTSIYGKQLSFLTSTEEFFFSDLSTTEGGKGVVIDTERINAFDHEGNFFVVLKFSLEEMEVEEYLKSLLELGEDNVVLTEEFKIVDIAAKPL